MKKLVNLLRLAMLCVAFNASGQQEPLQVFPTPQKMIISSPVFTPSDFYFTGIKSLDKDAVALLKEVFPISNTKKGTPIRISKLKDKALELQRTGAYRLLIKPKGITIEIVDDRSLFYAAQTVKQLVKHSDKGQLLVYPCTITDYPDVVYRGTVEGFYGNPWSFEDRIEQLRFYGKLKLNVYIYGPKDDPYHSSPSWREPYPTEDAKHIEALVAEASRNKVDFVWAIHPGKDILWNKSDSNAVLNKFEKMYDLGVRSFAVFFDDISGEGTRPEKQARLLNYINTEFIQKKRDVKPLIMCPTEYNKSWADPKPNTYLDILGDMLDPSILVLWTGDRVVGDITLDGLNWVNKRIERNSFVWWNFPVSDYVRDHLLMGPSYGLDVDSKEAMSGFVSNPMDKPEASKVGVYGVAMYAWNMKAYDSNKSWENACNFIMPEAADAFKTFCAHNSDPGRNGHKYRRDESVEIMPVAELFKNELLKGIYSVNEATKLNALFTQISKAPSIIRNQSSNINLIKEIDPWLIQFELLGKAGLSSIKLANAWTDNNEDSARKTFGELTALLDSMQVIDHNYNQNEWQPGIKTGSLVLTPFIKYVYKLVGDTLHLNQNNNLLLSLLNTNMEQLKQLPVLEKNNEVFISPVLETIKMKPGDYVGVLVAQDKRIASASFNLPSPNSDWRCFEWSEDGEIWITLQVKKNNTDGKESANVDAKARYLRMRNNSSEVQSFYLKNFILVTK